MLWIAIAFVAGLVIGGGAVWALHWHLIDDLETDLEIAQQRD